MKTMKNRRKSQEESDRDDDDEDISEDDPKQQQKQDNNHLNLDPDNGIRVVPISKFSEHLKNKNIVINISDTQYPVVEEVAEELGWEIQTFQGIGDWDVWWTDHVVQPSVLYRMHLHQKINHFPGIEELAHKNLLAMNLTLMKQNFGKQYDFFPETWSIPIQFPQFQKHFNETQDPANPTTYIVKPEALSQGRGIFLTRNIRDVLNGRKYVIQKYVENPMLIEGLKFDLRLYVLLKSLDPLQIYIYEQGLVRLATQRYEKVTQKNIKKVFMHLTNYSLNKRNPDYKKNQVITEDRKKQDNEDRPSEVEQLIQNDESYNQYQQMRRKQEEQQQSEQEVSILSLDTEELEQIEIGHKRSLASFWDHLLKQDFTPAQISLLKQKINDLIVKTIISGSPALLHQYKYCQPQSKGQSSLCFHILGFDIMVTQDLEPMIIEINHTPSFQTNSDLDHRIKKGLIMDTLRLMDITKKNKKKLYKKGKKINKQRLQNGKREAPKDHKNQVVSDKEPEILGGYTMIYPFNNEEQENEKKGKQYLKYIEYANKIHRETADTRKKMIKQEQYDLKHKNQGDREKPKQAETTRQKKNEEKNKQDYLKNGNARKIEKSLTNTHTNTHTNMHTNINSANINGTQKQYNIRTKIPKKSVHAANVNVFPNFAYNTNNTDETTFTNYSCPFSNNFPNSQDHTKKPQTKNKTRGVAQSNLLPNRGKGQGKGEDLIRFSDIMMKFVITKQQCSQPFDKFQTKKVTHQQSTKLHKPVSRNQNERNHYNSRNGIGDFIAPKMYHIVDQRVQSRKQIEIKKDFKVKQFNQLLRSIEPRERKQHDPKILSSLPKHNKVLYKKKKRYSVV